VFDPNFDISLGCDDDILSLIASFTDEFEAIITRWQGWWGETEAHYINFHQDKVYSYGSLLHPYILRIIGKLETYDAMAQESHKEFARKVVKFFEEHGCIVAFSASFSIEE
jgi:hypothetical protein